MEPDGAFQVYATSDGCLSQFPDNTPSKFKIRLNPPKVFSTQIKKVSVGLARLIYDSELFNLGENTGTYFEVYTENQYFKVEFGNAHVQSPEAAKREIDKALKKTPVIKSSLDGTKTQGTLEDYITLKTDKEKFSIELKDVHDFGISPMLRKLLGFHREQKFFSENFQFRKQCREFLLEIAEKDEFIVKMNELDVIFDRRSFKSKKFSERNLELIQYHLPIQQFYHQLNTDFPFILQSIVKQRADHFQSFIEANYYPAAKEIPYILENENPKTKIVTEIKIPFEVCAMIDYLIFTCVNESSRIPANRTFKLKMDSIFNPDLFNVLYVYTNIVKPVSFNDSYFRLLDLVCLNKQQLTTSGVSEHKSTLFKELDVTTVDEIEFQINTSLGSPAPFIHGPVFIILEFKESAK
jgi:hypothetical protein